jgi:hypothetical protein
MSYNNIFSDSSHLSHNRILKDPVKVNLGDKLNKVRDRKHPQKEIAIYDVNDKPTFKNVSDYGLSLIDTLSLSDLKASILETNEEAIRLTSDSNNEINFFTGSLPHGASNLRMQIKNSDTIIKNNLLVDNIKDVAGNSTIKSTATDTKFLKQTNTFRYDDNATGYVSIHNSNSTSSGYVQWYSGDAITAPVRNAFMGLSKDNIDENGSDLSLSMERSCNFNILKDSVSVMKFDNFNDTIDINNPTTFNDNLILNNSKTQYLYDNTHTIGSERDKLNIKNSIWGLNHSVSDFGTLSLCAGGSQNRDNKSRIQLYGYGMTEKLQFLIGDNKLYSISDYENIFHRPIYLAWNGGYGKLITIQGGATNNTIYEKSGLNLSYNISYTPYTEVESVTTPTQYTSKVLIDNDGVALKVSDSANVLPSDVLVASNSAITCSKDVIIQGTSIKLNFNSNNYIQNDGNNNLNLYLNSSKSFIANTGDTVSTYDFKINSISKLKISDSKMDIDSDLSIAHRKKITFLNAFLSNNGTSIGQNDLCNEINGAKSTNSQGVNSIYGHMRLSSGWGTSKSSIDLYGFGEVYTNRIITTIENVEVSEVSRYFHDINISARTQHIYPQADITYDLGVADDNEWRNVYTENISVGGQFHHSDRRIKDNIIDLPNDKGLSFIQQLRPVQYTYKKSTQKRKHWGFIAQEIREVLSCDDYSIWGEQKTEFKKQHIAPSEFLGPIVKSIQELYDIVTSSSDKPVIIKEQVKSVDHKCNCNSVELISQLNSYEIELLEKGEQLKVLDNQLEELVEDNLSLKKNSNIIIERLNELELKNKELENKLNEKTNEIIDEDTDGGSTSLLDSLQIRNHENELKISKLENKLKKLTTIINKLVKNN